MAQLSLWQKILLIDDLTDQVYQLEKNLKDSKLKLADATNSFDQKIQEYETQTYKELQKKHQKEIFLNQLLNKQAQEQEAYNQIITQINEVIDERLADPEEYLRLNVNPKNPKEIELIKKALRLKILGRVNR
jgi:uncharacterized protein (DUF2164 family)